MLRGIVHRTVPSYDRLVESLDAFDDLSLVAYPDGLRNLSRTFTFSSIQLVAQSLRILSIDSSLEERYARNHFDRRHDFAADRCIVTWPHGRSSVYYRGGELEPQIGSLNITGNGPKGAGLGNKEVLMPLVQLVLVLIVVGVLLGLINRYIPMGRIY